MLAPKLTSLQSQPRKSAQARRAPSMIASVSALAAKQPWTLLLWPSR